MRIGDLDVVGSISPVIDDDSDRSAGRLLFRERVGDELYFIAQVQDI
jgi:hypothetical protein